MAQSISNLVNVSPAWKKVGRTMRVNSTGGVENNTSLNQPQPQPRQAQPAPQSFSAPQTTPQNMNRNTAPLQMLSQIKDRAQQLQTERDAPTLQPPATPTPAQPSKALFPSVVGSLAARGTEGGPRYTQAQDAYQQAVQRLSDFRTNIADKKADIYSDPVSARVMQGRDQAVQQANAEKLAALQSAVQEQQTGIGLEQTQQQIENQALQQAGTLAQPVQVAPGNTLFAPTDGQEVAGGLGGYANYRTAEQVMGLISQYPDANYIYDQTLSPQENLQALQQQVQGSPTYQRGVYGVPGQGSVAGAQAVQTAQQGYNDSYQTYNQLVNTKTNADALSDNLLTVFDQYGISRTDARPVNRIIRDVTRKFGSEGQAAVDTALQEVQAAYSNLLAVGGGVIPTEATEAAGVLLNPDASIPQILASISELKKAGNLRLQAQDAQVQNYWQQLQGASNQVTQGGAEFSVPEGADFSW